MEHPILIIGGNSGIGLATVERLGRDNLSMLAAARDTSRLVELGVQTLPFDASKEPDFELPEKLGGLVYFPGTINLKPFHRLSDDDFLSDFQTNCLGAVRVIRKALPALKAGAPSSVVLFSTVAVAQGMPFHASVAAAKAAVEGLGKSLAAELAPHVRVNVIAPSLTDTPLASGLLGSDAKREAAEKRHPLQSIGRPEDVAGLVAFLLSDASKFMTGQVLRPDGGLSNVRTF
ncbi:oxidoreductase [Haloferula helveola]|uniref:Oxidoreductase n=1 Tax=Haloferula helveola TaxID=490095 RepID=A0ABM7RHH3_9BACT|nr:oxidoreductase [Haloferula helveola]